AVATHITGVSAARRVTVFVLQLEGTDPLLAHGSPAVDVPAVGVVVEGQRAHERGALVAVAVPLGERRLGLDAGAVDIGEHRLPLGIELSRHDARCHDLFVATGLEIRVIGVEIPINDGHDDRARRARARIASTGVVRTLVPVFDGAGARAAVSVAKVSVVALLGGREDDAVPALRAASAARAVRLRAARRAAAIEGDDVAVVAALGSLDDAVTALRLRAFAGAPLALEPELEPTLRIAPVEVFGVAVVAALVRIDDAVAAQVDARTRLPGGS